MPSENVVLSHPFVSAVVVADQDLFLSTAKTAEPILLPVFPSAEGQAILLPVFVSAGRIRLAYLMLPSA